MISKKKLTGLAIATAAAGLFATAMIPATAVAAEGGMVHCTGVNACKGKGFVALSEKECKDKGGKIEAEKK